MLLRDHCYFINVVDQAAPRDAVTGTDMGNAVWSFCLHAAGPLAEASSSTTRKAKRSDKAASAAATCSSTLKLLHQMLADAQRQSGGFFFADSPGNCQDAHSFADVLQYTVSGLVPVTGVSSLYCCSSSTENHHLCGDFDKRCAQALSRWSLVDTVSI